MSKKTVVFDFDNVIANLRFLEPFKSTKSGRNFLSSTNIEIKIKEKEGIREVLHNIESNKKINSQIIISNNLERRIFESLNLGINIPIISNVKVKNYGSQNLLFVTDKSSLIHTAYGFNVATIGVDWGYNLKDQLERAGAGKIISKTENIVNIVNSFQKENFGWVEKNEFDNLKTTKISESLMNTEIQNYNIMNYYPYGSNKEMFRASGSDKILNFKAAKDFSLKEIKNGEYDKYYYNGLKNSYKFIDTITDFYSSLREKIYSLDISGKTIIIALPNSQPEFNYRCDINHQMANTLNEEFAGFEFDRRVLERFKKVDASHINSISRNLFIHYGSIGFRDEQIGNDVKNIILFDDITTSNTQLTASADIIRNGIGFNGNIYGITLGKTI